VIECGVFERWPGAMEPRPACLMIAADLNPCNAHAVYSDTPDEQLMRLYGEGNVQAFEALYHRHKGPVFRFFLRQLAQAVAEELAQDVWTRLIHARQSYQVNSQFTTFLYTIARNRLIDHVRRQTIRPVGAEVVGEGEMDCIAAPMDGEPVHQLHHNQRAARLLHCIKVLPAEQREAFLLKEESNLPLEVIGEICGSNKEAIKSRLRYAVKKLKQCMGELL
jgi:RNA polymerase sigma-70 factor (ECF subfamily)